MPCPCRRHRGCSDCRHTELPLPLPWDWPHWTVQCRKDGTGAAGAFPDSPFRECPSLGAAGGLRHSARVCVCVCTWSQVWARVCATPSLCSRSDPGTAPAVCPGLGRNIVPVAQGCLCLCPCWVPHSWVFPGHPGLCSPTEGLAGGSPLTAAPTAHPAGPWCQGRTRGYDTGPPLVFCHEKPQHLPGSSPSSSLGPSPRSPRCCPSLAMVSLPAQGQAGLLWKTPSVGPVVAGIPLRGSRKNSAPVDFGAVATEGGR